MGKRLTTRVTHVLPVSDDGGSTAEIVRVLGGPAVGDIRSRCLRLSDDSTDEGQAVKALLGHRLHPSNAAAAKHEWAEIVDGTHALWKGIGTPYRDTIRAFLLHFNYEILREPTTLFNFCNGSVGNFFFAGARTFFKSMDAAIFLYGRVSHIPPQSLVTPAVATADRLTLGAELVDGTIIRGQNAISHPPPAPGALGTTSPQAYASPAASSSNLVVRKDSQTFLHSRIKRVFYASSDISSADPTKPYEIYPPVHSAVPGNIYEADGIIYAMGSFFTSICPSLVLKGVGEAIARRRCRKILVLNGCIDRETHGMDRATDYVRAVTDHLNRVHSLDPEYRLDNPPSSYVNCIFVPRGSDAIEVDELELRRMGIKKIVQVETVRPAGSLVFSKERSGGEEGEGARRGSAAQSSKSSLDPAYAAAGGDAAKPQVLYDTADLIRMLKWALTTHRRPATGDNGAAPAANGGEEPSEEGSDEGWVSSSDEDEPEATDAVVGVTLGAGLQVAGGPG
ncbi:hypothetical protein DFJ74DRAFT_676791 [Hyaloraphidium curvatum]|nr:hypothetical protein DFJ74DRAFT_676791 [Hyaloraphidium curvatum]